MTRKKKRHPHWKGSGKTVILCRWHDSVYWSGQPFPSPRDISDPGIEPRSLASQADSLPLSHQGSPRVNPNIKDGLWVIMIHISVGSSIITDVPLWCRMLIVGEAMDIEEARDIWEISVLSAQFCCELKKYFKIVYFFLKKAFKMYFIILLILWMENHALYTDAGKGWRQKEKGGSKEWDG